MTPDEAMKFFCAYHNVAPRSDLLDRLGLAEKRKTQFGQLSTGLQRRLALALAVAHNPQVLFLDEPTAGLDVPSRVELHNMMRELKASGTTIILATHDMAEAEELSDRVAILLQGKIVTAGTPLEITAGRRGPDQGIRPHTRPAPAAQRCHLPRREPTSVQRALCHLLQHRHRPDRCLAHPVRARPTRRADRFCVSNARRWRIVSSSLQTESGKRRAESEEQRRTLSKLRAMVTDQPVTKP